MGFWKYVMDVPPCQLCAGSAVEILGALRRSTHLFLKGFRLGRESRMGGEDSTKHWCHQSPSRTCQSLRLLVADRKGQKHFGYRGSGKAWGCREEPLPGVSLHYHSC